MSALYVYTWANNEKRKALKGRACIVLARFSLNSALVRFLDSGQMEIVSRNALRRAGEARE